MNTCQEIIDRALGKLGIKSAYVSSNSTDSASGLRALKSVYRHLITSGAFGELNDIVASADMTAFEFTRIVSNGYNITLPANVTAIIEADDYGDIGYYSSNEFIRPPRDGSVVTITDNTATPQTTADYIYDGQVKAWIEVDSLQLTDNAPLSRRDDNGLCALLATHLADEFGQQITPTIAAHARSYQMGLTQNWSQAGEEIHRGDYF